MPTTSFVIPTKNDIAHIDKCISSLMPFYKAGYINEITIVDGHSTDGTLEILKKYPVNLVFEKGKGTVNIAFDYGWRQSKGEIIILMNSDVYVEDNFFPRIYDFLSDASIGWISCHERAAVSNNLSKAQFESWKSVDSMLSSSDNWFHRLYNRLARSGDTKPLCGGPCMVVRRACLEETNGLIGFTLGTMEACGDVCFSQRIENAGKKAVWWRDAPIYHHPKTNFKELRKQFYVYGKSMAYMHEEKEFRHIHPWYWKTAGLLARLSSPFSGVYLAIRYRNPSQLIVYPVPRFYWVWGYIQGWIEAKNPDQPVYSEPGISPSR